MKSTPGLSGDIFNFTLKNLPGCNASNWEKIKFGMDIISFH